MPFIESILPWLLNNPEVGWVVVMAYLAYELRGKRGRLYKLDKKLTSAIIVIRALARTDDEMDEDTVDEYLVENGMEPEDFIEGAADPPPKDSTGSDTLRSDGEGRFDVDEVLFDSEEEEGGDQDFTSEDSQ
jgi:hypothetical protein